MYLGRCCGILSSRARHHTPAPRPPSASGAPRGLVDARVQRLLPQAGNEYRYPWGDVSVTADAIRVGEQEVGLTGYERRLLALLLAHRGYPVSRAALGKALPGRPPAAGSRAVDMQMVTLRRKLRRLGTARPSIHTVRGAGYLMP